MKRNYRYHLDPNTRRITSDIKKRSTQKDFRKKNVKNENMSELMRELERRELIKERKNVNALFSRDET